LNESRGALNATLLEREVLEAVYKKTKMNVFRISCRKTFSYSYLRSKGVFLQTGRPAFLSGAGRPDAVYAMVIF